MKILIVDDDPDDRIMASMALEEIEPSLKVEFAEDGQDLMDRLNAMKLSRKKLPDLILLDLNMPRKDGRTALLEIKSDPLLKQLSIIIFSTSAAEQDREFSLSKGASSYIVKPSTYPKVVEVFRSISRQMVAQF